MRMIICAECNSVIVAAEQEQIETCKCGDCKMIFEKGKYLYAGENAIAMGIDDASMVKALRLTKDSDKNIDCLAYMIRDSDPNFYKVPKL
jgi:DNA-directed RNA polymerase subunit M/transcription elongation factor TFIIS